MLVSQCGVATWAGRMVAVSTATALPGDLCEDAELDADREQRRDDHRPPVEREPRPHGRRVMPQGERMLSEETKLLSANCRWLIYCDLTNNFAICTQQFAIVTAVLAEAPAPWRGDRHRRPRRRRGSR